MTLKDSGKEEMKEKLFFSGMSESEIANLYVEDEYPSEYTLFYILNDLYLNLKMK